VKTARVEWVETSLLEDALEDQLNLGLVGGALGLVSGGVLYAHVDAHVFHNIGVNDANAQVVDGEGRWVGHENWHTVLHLRA